MATYRNPNTGEEFNSGNLAFGLTMTFLSMVILSGAVAAIPAAFGLVMVAAWVWGVLVSLGIVGLVSGYVQIKKTMQIDD